MLFLVWWISGSRLFSLFLAEGGVVVNVVSTIVPPQSYIPFATINSPTLVKQCRSQMMRFKRVEELE